MEIKGNTPDHPSESRMNVHPDVAAYEVDVESLCRGPESKPFDENVDADVREENDTECPTRDGFVPCFSNTVTNFGNMELPRDFKCSRSLDGFVDLRGSAGNTMT
jgi:hypothetical protein